jgi:hypothetical protein
MTGLFVAPGIPKHPFPDHLRPTIASIKREYCSPKPKGRRRFVEKRRGYVLFEVDRPAARTRSPKHWRGWIIAINYSRSKGS